MQMNVDGITGSQSADNRIPPLLPESSRGPHECRHHELFLTDNNFDLILHTSRDLNLQYRATWTCTVNHPTLTSTLPYDEAYNIYVTTALPSLHNISSSLISKPCVQDPCHKGRLPRPHAAILASRFAERPGN